MWKEKRFQSTLVLLVSKIIGKVMEIIINFDLVEVKSVLVNTGYDTI
jgi:hypothetical protein